MIRERAKVWLKLLAPVACSICGLTTLRLLGPDVIDQRKLSGWVAGSGDFAPLAFISFLAVRPLLLLPGQLFTAIGGMLFGTFRAALYALAGDLMAMMLVFFLARRYGARLMRRIAKGRYPALARAARRHDFRFALIATISPIVPTDVAVAAAAASGARFRSVLGGAMLATTPGVVLTAQFGSALSQGKTILSLLSAAGLIISLVGGILLGRRIVHEVSAAPAPLPEEPESIPIAQVLAPSIASSEDAS